VGGQELEDDFSRGRLRVGDGVGDRLGFVVLEGIKPYSFTFVNKNYLTKGNKKSRPEAACASNPKKST